jgi:4-aminobutyrate aminotransferase-like enzyme
MFHPSDPKGSIQSASKTLEKLLARYPGQFAAIWMELVAGEGGYYPGTEDYFHAIIEPCRKHNILVIFDEVQTFTRLSRPYAFQHFHLEAFADLVTIGKISQVCATLYKEELKPKGPLLSQTFTASSAAFATGLATLDQLEAKNCFGDDGWNMSRHRYFAGKLQALAEKYPGKISGPYGEGMMIAFTPGTGAADEAKNFVQKLYDRGLMSFVAGGEPTRIRFLPPPGITTEAHIDMACKIIEQALA